MSAIGGLAAHAVSIASASTVELERPAAAHAQPAGGSQHERRLWRCTCGQLYHVWGCDRHRVYWPLDAPADGAVMDGCCVNCRRPLPGKKAHCQEPA
jgi:hypothetical protein